MALLGKSYLKISILIRYIFFLVLAQSTSLLVSNSLIQIPLLYLSHTVYAGTLSPDSSSGIPTVTENLYDDGTIPAEIVSVSFEPITSTGGEEQNGVLTWGVQLLFKTLTQILKYSLGGTDSSLYTGSITYTYALTNHSTFIATDKFA